MRKPCPSCGYFLHTRWLISSYVGLGMCSLSTAMRLSAVLSNTTYTGAGEREGEGEGRSR